MAYDIFSGETSSRDWSCGGASTMTLKQAVEKMQARYISLSKQGTELSHVAQKLGKPLPASVVRTYHVAVDDYLKFGRQVFASLDEHKISVDQIILRNGKPIPDPGNPTKFRTVRISAPLSPPMFSGMAGTGRSETGLGPVIAAAGVWAFRIGVLVLSSLAVVAIDKIRLTIHGPDDRATERGETFLKVFNELTAKGYPVDKAVEAASGIPGQPQVAEAGGGGGDDVWKWVTLVAGGAIGFTLLSKKMGR